MKKTVTTLIFLLFANTLIFAQGYVNVTFRHYPTSTNVVRAFVPGTFNNWGPNSSGRIDINAPSIMSYVDSLGCYIKKVTLTTGSTHNYKFHEHYYGAGTNGSWFTDPLNPLINYDDNNNSILHVENLMIFQILPANGAVVMETPPTIMAGVFTANIDAILLDQSTITLDGSVLATFEGNIIPDLSLLSYTTPVLESGDHKVVINVVTRNGEVKSDSSIFNVGYLPIQIEDLPQGVVDGINYIDNSTVTLSLCAPYKRFVYVIGDFNKWQIDPAYYMKLTPDSSRFWLTITGLEPQKEYIFQYLVDGSIKIADPYADKVSDPGHDSWITDATYPDLIPYPTEYTSEIASVLQTAQESYPWQVTSLERPEPQDLVIYELLLRDFITEHDYTTLIDTLGYLENLGVNAIELMPINEFEGNESWGYNPSFYFAPDKYYGPNNDLKRFIDEAHKRGIAVLLDIVLNHAYGQCPLVRLYANDMSRNPWFNQQAPHTDFSWGYDFNHERQATKDFVDRVLSYWLTEYRFDGFRFDFTRGFTNKYGNSGPYDPSRIAILKRIYDHIRSVDATAYVVLEHLVDDNREMKELAEYGMMLWGNMSHDYQEAAMGYSSNLSWGSYKTRGWNVPHLVTYMESHDEERLMFKNPQYGNSSGDYSIKILNTALDRIKLVSAFFFTIPGPKMIWQFGELGYDYSIDFNGRLGKKPIRWDYFDETARKNLYKTMQALINLKKEYDTFRTIDFVLSVIGYSKRINLNHESMDVTVIGNFGVVESSVNPYFQNAGIWYDFFSGDSIEVMDPQAYMILSPGEFHIYSTVKLPTPENIIIPKVPDKTCEIIEECQLQQNYPNPFSAKGGSASAGNAETTIRYTISTPTEVLLEVYTTSGQKVKTLVHNIQSAGDHSARWNGLTDDGIHAASGLYLYRLRIGDFVQTRKMVLIK